MDDLFDWHEPNKLTSTVIVTDIDEEISKSYDYEFTGVTEFTPSYIDKSRIPDDFGIGLIVGKSGNGKSTLLKEFGDELDILWDNDYSVASNFNSFNDAKSRLNGAGFNSITDWTKPYKVLSTGQKYRADLARSFGDNVIIDEFTSVVDRSTAISLSNSVRRYVDDNNVKGMVFASCHRDIIDYLRPDWIMDVDENILTTRGLLRQRPSITLTIHPCDRQVWEQFKNHHYLDGSMNKTAQCWLMEWDGILVGFYATLPQPSGTISNAWRGHRCVILPEFQGLGFGKYLSDAIAQLHIDSGKRFFGKTSSVLGVHREKSDLWKGTSKNKQDRQDYKGSTKNNKFSKEHKEKHMNRICYSHEYIGNK